MAITLTYGTATLQLPPDLFWADRHQWQAVEQTVTRTITGALIVEAAARSGGRPITLQPEDGTSAWITLADLEALLAWAQVPGREMQLNILGETYDVVFRHHDNGGVNATPLVHYRDPDSTDYYLATIRLMEI